MKTDKEKLQQAIELLKEALEFEDFSYNNTIFAAKIQAFLDGKTKTIEPKVGFTYKEIFDRASSKDLNELGVNPWYISEGGDPKDLKFLTLSQAKLIGVSDYEFVGRCD